MSMSIIFDFDIFSFVYLHTNEFEFSIFIPVLDFLFDD